MPKPEENVQVETVAEEPIPTVEDRLYALRARIAAQHPFPAQTDDMVELVDILLMTMPKRALATTP